MRIHTTHTRDAALRELGRLNRWLIAGSVVLTGAFAEAAASAFPGKTSRPAAARGAKSSTVRADTPAKTATHPLRPPAQAPQAATEAQNSTQAAPAQESAPAQETHESAPESAPTQESHESAPAQEPAPEPEPEASAPVVSGGS
jgi:type IV secretory pathway VirB10-like protein